VTGEILRADMLYSEKSLPDESLKCKSGYKMFKKTGDVHAGREQIGQTSDMHAGREQIGQSNHRNILFIFSQHSTSACNAHTNSLAGTPLVFDIFFTNSYDCSNSCM
jgi:hypothetical protein